MTKSYWYGICVCITIVNCFQISNFVLWQTADSCKACNFAWLWIAFKLVILSYGKQQNPVATSDTHVVNCFQISNFVLWQTAKRRHSTSEILLWIAFKLVILSYGKQHMENKNINKTVVNCFQISNFVLWQTATGFSVSMFTPLWIAFKLVILSYGKQRFISFGTFICVVNCFQISNFVLWQTAIPFTEPNKDWLWIAFKLVILSYGKQQYFSCTQTTVCCELLSN